MRAPLSESRIFLDEPIAQDGKKQAEAESSTACEAAAAMVTMLRRIASTHVEERFEETKGLDPLFRTNDGSNCDHSIDTSTVEGRRHAYSLLVSRGLLRIALPVPGPYGGGGQKTAIRVFKSPTRN